MGIQDQQIYYPPTGFAFKVQFLDLDDVPEYDTWFQEVAGLNVQIETEDYMEAGRQFSKALPTRTRYGTLSLKRGFLKDSKLADWVFRAVESFEFKPLKIQILLLNAQKNVLGSWNVLEAIPIKWDISTFSAESSGIVVESLELKYESFHYQKVKKNANRNT